MSPQPPLHVKWMALGMLRGLRSQLPRISQDPFRQVWIAPWIANQLKVETKFVRTWFGAYDRNGGDAMAVKGSSGMDPDGKDVPSVSVSAVSPGSLPSSSSPASPSAASPEAPTSVTVTASPATLPSAAPSSSNSDKPTRRAKKGEPKTQERPSEIRWHAVGMARALDAHLPLIAQMHGFDEVIASELGVKTRTVQDWIEEYRRTGTADPESVPPPGEEVQPLKEKRKGKNRYDVQS